MAQSNALSKARIRTALEAAVGVVGKDISIEVDYAQCKVKVTPAEHQQSATGVQAPNEWDQALSSLPKGVVQLKRKGVR